MVPWFQRPWNQGKAVALPQPVAGAAPCLDPVGFQFPLFSTPLPMQVNKSASCKTPMPPFIPFSPVVSKSPSPSIPLAPHGKPCSLMDIMLEQEQERQQQQQQQQQQQVLNLPSVEESISRGKETPLRKALEKAQSKSANAVGLQEAVSVAGEQGPFEKSFLQARQTSLSSSVKKKKNRPTPREVNNFVQITIESLSEEGYYVSKELVIAQLCREFGVHSTKELGFHRETDIPALLDLIQLQKKASRLYMLIHIHAFNVTIMVTTTITTN